MNSVETESKAIVKAIISIAVSLGFEVIAEGVETEMQSLTLRSLGVSLFQGFLLSRPLAPEQTSFWLEQRSLESVQAGLRAMEAVHASLDTHAASPVLLAGVENQA